MTGHRVSFSSGRVRRLAERAVLRGLSPGAARRFGKLLSRSEQDRQGYTELVRLFGALEGDVLIAGQHERVLAGILEAVGGPGSRAWSGLTVPRLALVSALSLVMLVLVPLLLVLGRSPIPAGQALQVRGTRRTLRGTAPGTAEVRAFCIRRGQVVPPPRLAPDLLPADALCRMDDEIQLMVGCDAGYSHLLVIGHLQDRQGQDQLLWYYPLPPTGRSGLAPREVRDEPLGSAIRLSVNHRPGELRILALFSHAPLQASTAYLWLRSLDQEERFSDLARRMGLGDLMTALEQRVILVQGAEKGNEKREKR